MYFEFIVKCSRKHCVNHFPYQRSNLFSEYSHRFVTLRSVAPTDRLNEKIGW